MAAAGTDTVVTVVSPPPPETMLSRGCPVPAAVRFLFLAGMWVTCAGMAAVTVASRAWGDNFPVVAAALETSAGALLFSALIVVAMVVRLLQLLLALRARGFRLGPLVKKYDRKVSGASMPEMPQKKVALGRMLLLTPFILLLTAGFLVLELSVEGSPGERIGIALFDVGVLGITAVSCFFTIPASALDVWNTKARQCTFQNVG